MAYSTTHSVGTGSATELWSKAADGAAVPMEWEIHTDEDINLTWVGPFPNGENVLVTADTSPYTVLSPSRGWTSISAQAVSTTASVTLRPTIV